MEYICKYNGNKDSSNCNVNASNSFHDYLMESTDGDKIIKSLENLNSSFQEVMANMVQEGKTLEAELVLTINEKKITPSQEDRFNWFKEARKNLKS